VCCSSSPSRMTRRSSSGSSAHSPVYTLARPQQTARQAS
jgi:hypothetical protein